jgi:hypothetical protein
MKHSKFLLAASLFILPGLFSACSSSKEARTMKKTIHGNWTLQTINIEGNNSIINVKVFNEADNNCFIASTWNFVANNSMGTYTLPSSASGCSPLTRSIRWSIFEQEGEERKLQFKRLDDKKNPMDDNNGYRLTIVALTESSMQLKSAITYEGKPVNIVYNFIKNQ